MPTEPSTILVVDDAKDTLEILQRNLQTRYEHVFAAPSVSRAIEFLEGQTVDLVVTDLNMPEVNGLELVRYVRENLPDTEVMMITGYATIDSAVEAVKTGAEAYLPKPFTDAELFAAVEQALAKLEKRRASHQRRKSGGVALSGVIGDSAPMTRVFEIVNKTAGSTATALITGESGVGKELVARGIHYGSARAAAAFLPVNCGAIPESLFESELFGHMKGAFTGANESRAGFFMTADGGTIFLDEIGVRSRRAKILALSQTSVRKNLASWGLLRFEPAPRSAARSTSPRS